MDEKEKREKPDDEAVFVLHLKARRGVDAVRALRAALKVIGRRFGLRAAKVDYANGETTPP
jgi:hypothetical protein